LPFAGKGRKRQKKAVQKTDMHRNPKKTERQLKAVQKTDMHRNPKNEKERAKTRTI